MTTQEFIQQISETLQQAGEKHRNEASRKVDQAEAALETAKALVDQIEARMAFVRSAMDAIETDLPRFVTAIEGFRQLGQNLLPILGELPRRLVSGLDEGEQVLSRLTGELRNGLENAVSTVQETVEDAGETAREHMREHVEKVQESVGEIVEDFEERSEALLDQVSAMHDQADDVARELFHEAIPDQVTERTKEFLAGIDTLRATGMSKLEEFDNLVGSIQDKTKALTDLIHQVKPVLDLARQIL